MPSGEEIELRPARAGDGAAVFEVTRLSVAALAKGHYAASQITGWMGARTPAYYEDLIAKSTMVVAVAGGRIVGFVDAEPGEVTRLFLLPEATGAGLGKKLLAIGLQKAREGYHGPIKVESTINAERFYQHHGFRSLRRGYFSHGIGGDPIEIVHMELQA